MPLAGTVVVIDPNGLKALDGRATPKLPAFLGTGFDRPEDIEIKTLKNGKQMLYVATTTGCAFTLPLAASSSAPKLGPASASRPGPPTSAPTATSSSGCATSCVI